MKRKIIAILMVFALSASLVACGEEEETTITGMVVSVDGTVISLVEMDTGKMSGRDFEEGERPEMPEGREPPEGMTMPENGEMPDFDGENSGMRPGFGNLGEDMETTDVDIASAHISLEIDEGKASGSMDDIKAGSFVTITMNSKGEVTNVLVSSTAGFGGGRGMRQEN